MIQKKKKTSEFDIVQFYIAYLKTLMLHRTILPKMVRNDDS